jgi:putative effector of murein hydrolase
MGKWRRDTIWYRVMSIISFIYAIYIFKSFSGWMFSLLISIWIVLIILIEIKIKKDKKLPD